MMAMTDPLSALNSLQLAMDNDLAIFQQCKVHRDLQLHLDEPAGKTRFTYANISKRKVSCIAMFVVGEPVNGVPCFQLGYVLESVRRSGLGMAILTKSIEELSKGFKATPLQRLYLEAIVAVSNIP